MQRNRARERNGDIQWRKRDDRVGREEGRERIMQRVVRIESSRGN